MAVILDPEALAQRAENLGSLNGFRLAFVGLEPAGNPTHAVLDVEFHNANGLAPLPAAGGFRVSGGSRIRGGPNPGQVRVTQVLAGPGPNTLRLRVEPVGDYSTYTLHAPVAGFDPLLAALPFKFRPGCFNLNCAPDFAPGSARPADPVIDYLARDYESFKHVLITAMAERVPGWQPTSEADLDQVLIDLLAADADELADYQDRVGNEAFLATARKRLSLARHARLMDYHIHQGNQAATWLALRVTLKADLPAAPADEFAVWTGEKWTDPRAVIFALPRGGPRWRRRCFPLLNDLRLYTWGGTVTALEAGSTEADLTLPAPMTLTQAQGLAQLFLGTHPDQSTSAPTGDADVDSGVDHLLLQQELNPETGTINGRDPHARQVLRLLPKTAPQPRAEVVEDPVAGRFLVRVRWLPEDRLARRYCFTTRCDGTRLDDLAKFCANLLRVTHGRPWRTVFRARGSPLAGLNASALRGTDEAEYERTEKWGTLCSLTQGPLAYLDTPPGGEKATRSSLQVSMAGIATPWEEVSDLIESRGDKEQFVVETDELSRSAVRFGNGVNGRALPEGAVVTCDYRVGQGMAGNVGCDSLVCFDRALAPAVSSVWNPLDVTGGREPEPVAEILRRVPEAYRQRQLRAVTLEDYARRAEELPEVAHARAAYAWTGSWRTVRVVIDPAGTTELTPAAARKIAGHLDSVRLIGEDLEVRPASPVPLDIAVSLCAHPAYWPEDLRVVLEAEFSDGYTPDGRQGFFHPDLWSFGQALHASQIIGRALAVTGVERVLSVSMRRWNPGAGGAASVVTIQPEDLPRSAAIRLEMGPFEILRVANDPSHLERGRILFDIQGGRR